MFYLFVSIMAVGGGVLGFAVEKILRDHSQATLPASPLLYDLKQYGLKAFRLADHAASRGVAVEALHNEAVAAFRSYCEKAVADGQVSDKELKALSSLAGALGLSESLAVSMLAAVKRAKLAEQATEALADNTVTADEQREIDTLKDRLGLSSDDGRAAMCQALAETSKRRCRRFQFMGGGSIACGIIASMLGPGSAGSATVKRADTVAIVPAPVPVFTPVEATQPTVMNVAAPPPRSAAAPPPVTPSTAIAVPQPAAPVAPAKPDPCVPTITETFVGKVIHIADGDTLTVRTEIESIKIRLQGIDTPEDGQSFGAKAKQALSTLVGGKQVTVKKMGKDRYGRTLAFVELDGADVSERMVLDGWAWHYTEYNCEARLAIAERIAREGQRGLWNDPNPLPPWEYRARRASVAAARKAETIPVSPVRKPVESAKEAPTSAGGYWLNTSSRVRHNSSCQHYANTKRGRACGPSEGKACSICGG